MELICLIAEKYHGWPHEVAAFPFSYYKTLRDLYIVEKQREVEAVKQMQSEQTGDEDIDVDELIAKRRKQGLAVESL